RVLALVRAAAPARRGRSTDRARGLRRQPARHALPGAAGGARPARGGSPIRMRESLESGVRSPESEEQALARRSGSDRSHSEPSSDSAPTSGPELSSNSERLSDSRLPTPDSGLLVEGVRKSFRDPTGGVLEVLRGVSFALRAGEMAAVLGASGAGKTTLLHLLGGLEAADSGSARLDGF